MPKIDPNCKLLIHFDGADGATTYTAETGQTVTFSGGAQLDTGQSKFGGSSLLLDGGGDYVSLADHADWDFPGDFTVAFFARPASVSAGVYDYFVGTTNFQSGSDGWGIGVEDGTNLRFSAMYSGSWAINTHAAHGMTANNWYHIAVVRSGTSIKMYINGSAISTTTNNPATSITGSSALQLGRDGADTNWDYNGWVDEVLVVKGTALWTSNFTPPESPYSKSGSKVMFIS